MTLESDQRVIGAVDRLRTMRVCATNFVSKAAAHISNRGKDTGLIGATLLFIASKRTLTLLELMTRRYTTAVYPRSDASENPCNSTLAVLAPVFNQRLIQAVD